MIRVSVALLFLVVGSVASTAVLAADPIDPFVGTFKGAAEVETDDGLKKRDVTVVIDKSSRGFSVDWTTTIPKAGGKRKTKQFKIQFSPAKRKMLYAAGMRRNLFGKLVPLNPLEGDPYMWAAIRGDTLSIFGMHVTDDGGYEFQIYERKITPEGMVVTFKRFRNGEQLKDITATLKRVKK